MMSKRGTKFALVTFAVVVGVDQLTKTLVLRNVALDQRIDVIGPLRLVRRYNTGVAFSVGNGSALTAWFVTGVVVLLLGWVGRMIFRGVEPWAAVLLAAIAGGGAGNQLDRLFRGAGWNKGAVIDFLDIGFWPVFNVADTALSVGCVVLALWTVLGGGPVASSAAPSPVPSPSKGNTVTMEPVQGLRSDASFGELSGTSSVGADGTSSVGADAPATKPPRLKQGGTDDPEAQTAAFNCNEEQLESPGSRLNLGM